MCVSHAGTSWRRRCVCVTPVQAGGGGVYVSHAGTSWRRRCVCVCVTPVQAGDGGVCVSHAGTSWRLWCVCVTPVQAGGCGVCVSRRYKLDARFLVTNRATHRRLVINLICFVATTHCSLEMRTRARACVFVFNCSINTCSLHVLLEHWLQLFFC